MNTHDFAVALQEQSRRRFRRCLWSFVMGLLLALAAELGEIPNPVRLVHAPLWVLGWLAVYVVVIGAAFAALLLLVLWCARLIRRPL
jgi:hypothetical protein